MVCLGVTERVQRLANSDGTGADLQNGCRSECKATAIDACWSSMRQLQRCLQVCTTAASKPKISRVYLQ